MGWYGGDVGVWRGLRVLEDVGKEVSPLLPVPSAGGNRRGGGLSSSLEETVIIPHQNKQWGLWELREGASSNQRMREGFLEEVAGAGV